MKRRPAPEAIRHIANQAALSFLDLHFHGDGYQADYIDLLCEMATGFETDDLNRIASSALFGIVVEGLCDDFEDLQVETYNRVMSQVITFYRAIPAGREFHKRLVEFGLSSFEDLFGRVERLRTDGAAVRRPAGHPRKIMVLSRVTIGADVAVTSVIIRRLMNAFPSAEIVLMGEAQLSQLFGDDPRIRISPLAYSRCGGLIERFAAWRRALETVENETRGGPEGVLLIDPDSRLSQLGVLPLLADGRYLFFNSRASRDCPPKLSLSGLANLWMDRVFGESEFCHPTVWLEAGVRARAADFAGTLRREGCRNIITVNFGVGGNARKMLGDGFEEKLVLKLLSEDGTVVLLDRGAGPEEDARSRGILEAAAGRNLRTKDATFADVKDAAMSHGVIRVRSSIGEMASLIAESDEFIGYDSACRHIAAALGVNACTIFAGSNNPRFISRWNVRGPGRSEMIHVDTLTHPRPFEIEDVIARVIDARARCRPTGA